MSDLDRLEFNFFALLARQAILGSGGAAFQDLFVQVGLARWGADFEGRRPQGNKGDKKCDGYRLSDRTVFQCYAPREMKPRPLCNKIAEDFGGALLHRKTTPIDRWCLVHNDREELPTEAHELIINLRGSKNAVPIEILGPERFLATIMEIPRNGLALLFPQGLSQQDLRKIQFRDIDALIESMGSLDLPAADSTPIAPSAQKLAHNGFSDSVISLLKGGYIVHKRFADYFADTSRAGVGNLLAERFKRIYAARKAAGVDSEQIFFSIIETIGSLDSDRIRRATILGMVAYMFHTCEIFEDAPLRVAATS